MLASSSQPCVLGWRQEHVPPEAPRPPDPGLGPPGVEVQGLWKNTEKRVTAQNPCGFTSNAKETPLPRSQARGRVELGLLDEDLPGGQAAVINQRCGHQPGHLDEHVPIGGRARPAELLLLEHL